MFKNVRCLVTGGSGMIGRAVCQLLYRQGAIVTDASLQIQSGVFPWNVYQIDLTDQLACQRLFASIFPQMVFHLAGIPKSVASTSESAKLFTSMLQMNLNVLACCVAPRITHVLFTSSIGAYASSEIFKEGIGDDTEPMDGFPAWCKRIGEKHIQALRLQCPNTHFSIVRPCNIYGPGSTSDMFIPSFMTKIKHFLSTHEPVEIWGDGSSVRDFLFSEDCAEGIMLAMQYGTQTSQAKYLNLGSGNGVTIKNLVQTMYDICPFEYFFNVEKPSGFPKRVMDMSLATSHLGFIPKTSLQEGLKKTWQDYLDSCEEKKT